MADTDTTGAAGSKSTTPATAPAKGKEPVELQEVTLTRLPHAEGTPSYPCAVTKTKANVGDQCTFTLDSGTTYNGEAASVTDDEEDGFYLIEFVDGIHPVMPLKK